MWFFHRLLADGQLPGDLLVGAPFGDECEHLQLTRGEFVNQGSLFARQGGELAQHLELALAGFDIYANL